MSRTVSADQWILIERHDGGKWPLYSRETCNTSIHRSQWDGEMVIVKYWIDVLKIGYSVIKSSLWAIYSKIPYRGDNLRDEKPASNIKTNEETINDIYILKKNLWVLWVQYSSPLCSTLVIVNCSHWVQVYST